jgi:hypothetical protein
MRAALLVLFIAAGLQLTGADGASGALNLTSTMTVTPTVVGEGSSENSMIFTYTTGATRLEDGTVSVKVPNGWTQPQTDRPRKPGSVGSSTGTVVVVNRHIEVKDVTLCRTCSLVVTYSDAAAPDNTGTAAFVTRVALAGQPLEPLITSPTVRIEATDCADPQSVTTAGSPSLTATFGTCLTGGTVVTLAGSGFDDSSLGRVLECNDDPTQPTVFLGGLLNQTVPVSCSGISLSQVVSTSTTGTLSTTFTVISPTPGPPCGEAGDLVTTCPTDSAGGNAFTDAAAYPCPPTAAQLADGDSCTLSFADEGGKVQSVGISF